MGQAATPSYPLLEEMLRLKNLPLLATYTNGDVAKLFEVSKRAIQERVANGSLPKRNLPGKARFFPSDLEEFLVNSRAPTTRKPK